MKIRFDWKGEPYEADLAKPLDISIPLDHRIPQPNCFHAPPYSAQPLVADEFTGSVRAGAPVNFYNIQLNPHGNGTHTECVGHLSEDHQSIHDCLQIFHCLAELISVYPVMHGSDLVIPAEILQGVFRARHAEALIIRTLPNHPDKMKRNYSGSNPPYLSEDAMRLISARNYRHLLIDLPSVDREHDQGALLAHRAFWQYPDNVQEDRTITELIYVDNNIADGLYLLNIQIASFKLDVSPSKPVLYALKKR